MEVPRTFRVGMPGPFSDLVRDWAHPRKPAPSIEGLEGQWLELEGGPLPVSIAARIDRTDDGRFVLTGLLIGLRSRREITWETLRQIRPSALLALLFAGFDPRNPATLVNENLVKLIEVGPGENFDAEAWERGNLRLPKVLMDPQSMRENRRASAALQLWRETGPDKPSNRRVEPVNRPRASVATDLAEFAEIYMRHFAATPHRATTATAKELHCSRATAIRRLAECRRLGLLPPAEKKRTTRDD